MITDYEQKDKNPSWKSRTGPRSPFGLFVYGGCGVPATEKYARVSTSVGRERAMTGFWPTTLAAVIDAPPYN
jgi:hypothetical protein